jgi:hypothetical protein
MNFCDTLLNMMRSEGFAPRLSGVLNERTIRQPLASSDFLPGVTPANLGAVPIYLVERPDVTTPSGSL